MADDFYRELILDHYKNPRNHGTLDPADAQAEGQNPRCAATRSRSLSRSTSDDRIDEIRFEGRGCAISQAATSMLTELVQGRTAHDVAAMSKDELLGEIHVPLEQNPARLKCALLGLGVLKVALHRARGTALPDEWAGLDELRIS